MDTRVFWSVLCALLVFSGLVAAGVAMMVAAQHEAVRRAQDQAQRQLAQVSEQAVRAAQEQVQQQAAYQRWLLERRRLQPGQQCVGGVVVQVYGNAYTQLGTIAQPVHCSGDFADQPLR